MYRTVVFALAGLIAGSFLTALVHRVPRKKSVAEGRSRCPSCGAQLRARDNIPIVSYALLRGKCRSCGSRISPLYPVTEAATAALFVASSLAHQDVWIAALIAGFLAVLVAVGEIDAVHKIIPNRIVYPSVILFGLAILGLDLAGRGVHILHGLLGLLAYGGSLLIVALISPRGMGMGDVKLAGLIGLVLGSLSLKLVAVAAAGGILLGGVGGIVALLMGRSRKHALPFGPFLAAGAALAAFWGHEVADAYLRLF